MTEELAQEIMQVQQAAFPQTEELQRQRWYHAPLADDDLWFTVQLKGKLIGSTRVVHRRIKAPTGEFTVAGIGNVCAHPKDAAGIGAGRKSLKAVQKYITEAGTVDFGLLFCGERLRTYYGYFGWQLIENQIFRTDAEGNRLAERPADSELAMIYPGRLTVDQWPDGEIDLNGRDW